MTFLTTSTLISTVTVGALENINTYVYSKKETFNNEIVMTSLDSLFISLSYNNKTMLLSCNAAFDMQQLKYSVTKIPNDLYFISTSILIILHQPA